MIPAARLLCGASLLGLLLVGASAVSAAVNPPAGGVRPGQQLKFRIDVTSSARLDVITDGRKSCKGRSDVGALQYTAKFDVVWGNFPPASTSTPGFGSGPQPGVPYDVPSGKRIVSFTYVVPKNARTGGDFVVNLSVFANCAPLSAFSANAQWGRYRVVNGKSGGSATPTPVPPVSRSGTDCGVLTIAGTPVQRSRVIVHAAAGCGISAGVAAGKVAGWSCKSPQPPPAERIWVCESSSGNWAVAVPSTSLPPSSCPRVLDDLKGTAATYGWAIWRGVVDCPARGSSR